MLLNELIYFLESFAPLAYQENYDNSGLIVGNLDEEINSVLVTVDVTEKIIEEAKSKKCDLIISHHPLIFKSLNKITGDTFIERCIVEAIKNDISIYAIHTNLDNIYKGVNKKIAEKLGIEKIQILQKKTGTLNKLITFVPEIEDEAGIPIPEKVRTALFEAGAGHIGNYCETSFNSRGTGTFKGNEATSPFVGEKTKQHHQKEIKIETVFPVHLQKQIVKALLMAHPYEEVAYDIYELKNENDSIGAGMIGILTDEVDEMDFLRKIKSIFNAGCIRHTSLKNKPIQRVAFCGGAGSFLTHEAIRQQADIFISSDFKYHQFFDAEQKIILADIGHYEIEQYTIDLIIDLIKEKFDNFAVFKPEVNTNPINYL